jgi:hypothetical protein
MDRGLMARALITGFVCFILAVGGFYYQSLMIEQSNRRYQEITGLVPSDVDGIGAIGLLIFIIVGLVVLMIAAGIITTLISSQCWDRPGDIFRASALAGGIAVMLLWIIFWCLFLVNITQAVFNHESFGTGDLLFYLVVVMINVLTVGLGALVAGVSGYATRSLARGVARRSG